MIVKIGIKGLPPQNMSEKPKQSVFDTCPEVRVFSNTYINLLKSLKEKYGSTAPELDTHVREAFKEFRKYSRKQFIQETHTNLLAHHEKIGAASLYIFSKDYHDGPLLITPHLNLHIIGKNIEEYFNTLLEQTSQTPLRREEIYADRQQSYLALFQHLQVLTIQSQSALEATQAKSAEILKKRKLLENMLRGLQIEDSVRENMEKLDDEEMTSEDDVTEALDQIKQMMGEHSIIVALLYEIAADFQGISLKSGEYTDSMKMLDVIFGEDGQYTEVMVHRLIAKIRQKIESKEFTVEDLKKDLEKVSGVIKEKIKEAPAGTFDMAEKTIREMMPKPPNPEDAEAHNQQVDEAIANIRQLFTPAPTPDPTPDPTPTSEIPTPLSPQE